tara:strand:- start:6078 stop:6401 length:324 start_codon:yes stop_codon:yes gene_type:complete
MILQSKIKIKLKIQVYNLKFFIFVDNNKSSIMSDISSRVKAIIVDKLGVDENEVVTTASFTNDLGADSLDTVELIMEFEREFNIQIPDDQAEKIETVGQAVQYIESA